MIYFVFTGIGVQFRGSANLRKWDALCENVSLGICGQQRPESADASAQSDQGLRSPLTECMERKDPDDALRMHRMSLIRAFRACLTALFFLTLAK